MANTQNMSSSHKKLIAVVVAAALVIILALLSAFVWPRWALNIGKSNTPVEEPTTPSIEAVALPDDATDLLKAMPDTVLNYARTAASASTDWQGDNPLEEYTVTYSTGDEAKDIKLIVAQWTTSDKAKTKYDALVGQLTGTELASGNVKVSGNTTGTYTVRSDVSDENKSVAVWQNDTVVFQATGTKAAIDRFYQKFPL